MAIKFSTETRFHLIAMFMEILFLANGFAAPWLTRLSLPPWFENSSTEAAIWLGGFTIGFVLYVWLWRELRVLTTDRGLQPKVFLAWTLIFVATLVIAPLLGSSDVYLYALQSRAVSHYEMNPFIESTASLTADPFFSYNYLPWTERTSAYGSLWIILGSMITSFVSSVPLTVVAFKALGGVIFLLIVFLVWLLTGSWKPDAQWKATHLVAWSPVLLFELIQNGHNDGLLILMILLALWCVRQQRMLAMAAALAAGMLVKLFAGLALLPMAAYAISKMKGRERWSKGLAALAVFVGVLVLGKFPFFEGGWTQTGGWTQFFETDVLRGNAGFLPVGFVALQRFITPPSEINLAVTASAVAASLLFLPVLWRITIQIWHGPGFSFLALGLATILFLYVIGFAPVVRSWYLWSLPLILMLEVAGWPTFRPWGLLVTAMFILVNFFSAIFSILLVSVVGILIMRAKGMRLFQYPNP